MQSIPTDVFPAFPEHARLKWSQRSDVSSIGISQAWYESVPVGLPDGGPWGPRAVLHDPGNAILVYAPAQERDKKYVVRTVLQAELMGTDYSINDGNLVNCDVCGFRFARERREDGECHWCECGYGPSADAGAEIEA